MTDPDQVARREALAAAYATRDAAFRLSEHFTLGELLASATADEHGIDNWPSAGIAAGVLGSLQRLAVIALEPIRAALGGPLVVHSGYRCPALNTAVGGQVASQHLVGEAADIAAPGVDNYALARLVELKTGVPFDQLILEGQRAGVPGSGWVHVSIAPVGIVARHQALTWDGRHYLGGLLSAAAGGAIA